MAGASKAVLFLVIFGTSASCDAFIETSCRLTSAARVCLFARKAAQQKKKKQSLDSLLELENDLHKRGYLHVIGSDDSGGAGCIAGPVVVASCCIRKPFSSFLTKASSSAEDLIVSQSEAEVLALVNDCKELTSETRRTVHEIAMGNPEVFATTVAVRSARAIDEMNLNRATQEAFAESIETLVEMHSLPQGETYAIVDGKISPKLYAARRIQSDDPNAEQFTTFPVRPYVNGDGNVYCVALASIIARVERERLMFELAVEHPEYGFADHNGYGRKDHLEALHRLGAVDGVHRMSFKQVKSR